MKLLIILSVEEYADEVRKILARQQVPIYSETEIHGFKTGVYQPDISNWFAHDKQGIYAKLFFSFQDEDSVNRVFKEVENYNSSQGDDQPNPLHAYQLEVEKYV